MYTVNIRKLQRKHRRELEIKAEEKAPVPVKINKNLADVFKAALAFAYAKVWR